MRRFTGIWATFKSIGDVNSALTALSDVKTDQLTIHSPYTELLPESQLLWSGNNLKYFSLAGGIIGVLLSLYMIVNLELTWIRPLSAKPILSPLTMVPVAFEMTILAVVIFTLVGIVMLTVADRFLNPLPGSDAYLTYRRFTRDRFGIVVLCKESVIPSVKQIVTNHQAVEVFVET
jgi:hypothetical protein